MEPFKSPEFQHEVVENTRALIMETICPKCFKSLGASPQLELLRIIERIHRCAGTLIAFQGSRSSAGGREVTGRNPL
jgi:hypothetical protein